MFSNDLRLYQALTLTERLRGYPAIVGPSPHESPPVSALRRYREWKSQSPFNQNDWFSRRLAQDGLREDSLLGILAESPESLAQRCSTPGWLLQLDEAFEHAGKDLSVESAGTQRAESSLAFLPLVSPLLRQAFDRVQSGARDLCRTYPSAPFQPLQAAELCYSWVPKRVAAMISQTAVLELHVARFKGLLEGETPEGRFQSFAERLKQPPIAIALLAEYPVLARLVVNWLDLWVESSLEFLGRLCADWSLLLATFFPGHEPGALEEISGGIGDRHKGGRCVLIARFSSGLNLVYKPKSLSVDIHFAELLDWLNKRGAPTLRIPRTLNRGTYGWAEFVMSRPCQRHEELEVFYYRQGAFLALLYMMEATDFHNENLIAVGENPMLIDLESMFRARFRETDPSQSSSRAELALTESVLRVGILPQRQWNADGSESIELSGIGGDDGQLSLRGIPLWQRGGTDQMSLVRPRVAIASAVNRPLLEGERINPLDFSEQLQAGFSFMYRLLLRCSDDLLAEDGPLSRFENDEVRIICRHTRFYKMILDESYHPDLLRNALDRDRIFDHLWFGADQDSLATKAILLIPSERAELWAGDIPFFSALANSRDLRTSNGYILYSFLQKTGLEAVRNRLQMLSEEDLKQQVWFIRGALTTLAMDTEPRRSKYSLSQQPRVVDPQELLAAATKIGDRLEQLALRGQQDASWIGLRIMGGRHWMLTATGLDLYSGLPGIALFLAYLGRATGDRRYTCLAELALEGIHAQLSGAGTRLNLVGAFEGWSGILYTYIHLAALWSRSDLLSDAEAILQRIQPLVSKDQTLDIIGGAAGAIAVLLGFYNCHGSSLALETAEQLGARLVTTAIPTGAGVGWKVPINPDRPLAGFSHGASGIAWSLLNLYGATGDGIFKETARRALAFECEVFSSEAKNWPDLRGNSVENGDPKFMTAWCHGAPGIGLSRLRMRRFLDSPKIEEDIDAAIETTLQRGFGANHSLCHGDLGNLELLLEASQVLGKSGWGQTLNRLTAQVVMSIEDNGWVSGVPLGVETPGLMNGLAGIGYGLLRLAEPCQIPSVLLLDPPPQP